MGTDTMKALILVASDVEDLEFFYPYYRLQEEGWEIDVATPDDVGTDLRLSVATEEHPMR